MSKPSPKRKAAPSAGSVELGDIVRRSRVVEVARRLEVSESLVRAVAAGQRRPGPELRAKMFEVYGIVLAVWDLSPAPAPATSEAHRAPVVADVAPNPVPKPTTVAAPAGAEPLGTTLEMLETNLKGLQQIADEADDDEFCTTKDQTAARAAVTAAIKALSKARGEDALTPSKVIASPAWAEAWTVVLDALEPYREALLAVQTAFRKVRGEAS